MKSALTRTRPSAIATALGAIGLAFGVFTFASCGGMQSAPRSTDPAAAGAPSASPAASGGTLAAGSAPIDSARSDAQSTGQAPPKTIVARHVLVQWMGCRAADANIVRTREQAHAVAEEVLRRLKAGEDFQRVVLDYSDEPNAGQRGGALGRFGHGAMDKQFEQAAFALAPGQISDIVETPFGFHVIQRLE